MTGVIRFRQEGSLAHSSASTATRLQQTNLSCKSTALIGCYTQMTSAGAFTGSNSLKENPHQWEFQNNVRLTLYSLLNSWAPE